MATPASTQEDAEAPKRRGVTVPTVSRVTGLSERAVRNALHRGELKGTLIGNRWVIPSSELSRLVGGEGEEEMAS